MLLYIILFSTLIVAKWKAIFLLCCTEAGWSTLGDGCGLKHFANLAILQLQDQVFS